MSGWQDFTQKVLPYMGADLLLSDLAHKLAPNQVYTPTLENGYGALVIATNTPSAACVVTCTVVDATGIVPPWSQRKTSDTIDPVTFTPPYSYSTASALRVTLGASVNQTINSVTFVFGMSSVAPSMQGSQLIRPDGRAYPIGLLMATKTLGPSLQQNVINAPGAGLSILLKAVNLATSGGTSEVIGQIGGTVASIMALFTTGSAPLNCGDSGILLDANTALQLGTAAGATGLCTAIYDVVT